MYPSVYSNLLAGRAAVIFIVVFMLLRGFVILKIVNVNNLS